MSTAREARQGDVVIAVGCCHGPRYVRATARPGWRCPACGSAGVDRGEHGAVVFGHDGALPEPDRDGAEVSETSALVNTTGQVLMAGAVRG